MPRLPKITDVVTEEKNGHPVLKFMHEDGSYSVQDINGIFTRHSKDGKVEKYEPTIWMEEYPDGTRREYDHGRLEHENFPNGVHFEYKTGTTGVVQEDYPNHTTYRDFDTPWGGYDETTVYSNGNTTRTVRSGEKVVHHETNGVTDTILYRMKANYLKVLKEKVGEKIKERDEKQPEASKERVIENRTMTKIKAAFESLFSRNR